MMIFLPASAQSTSASFVCRVIYTHCYHFLISILLPIQCKRTSFPTDLPKSLPLRSLATFFISDFMDLSFISQQHLIQLTTFLVLIFFPSAFGYCQTSQTLLVFFFLFWLLPLIFFSGFCFSHPRSVGSPQNSKSLFSSISILSSLLILPTLSSSVHEFTNHLDV